VTTNFWKNNVDGNWSTKSDWSSGAVPVSTDDVTINTASFHTITLSTSNSTINSLTVGNDAFVMTGGSLKIAAASSFANTLTISAGALTLGGATSVAGLFTQSGGTISGAGTLTLAGGADFTGGWDAFTGTGGTVLQGTTYDVGSLALDGGRTLENQGIFNWSGANIYLGYNPNTGAQAGGGTIRNDAGASFNIQSDSSIRIFPGTTAFVNAGALTKSVTTGTTNIYTPFTNTGTVSVQTGTLEFDGGGTSSAGAFTVASGATLQFGGSGTFTFTGGAYNAVGATSVVGGEADFSNVAITSFGGQGLFVSGGILELGGQSASVSSLSQSGGTIDGTGTLTLTGGASLTSSWDAFTGTGTTVLQGTTYDSGYVALDGGRILENQGAFNWTGPQIYLGYNPNTGSQVGGGTIQNDAGANFNIQSDNSIEYNTGTTAFTNAGTVTKSITKGATYIQAPFTNTGTVSVQTGTLEFDGGGTSSAGAFTVASGATLQFGGSGTFTFTGGAYNAVGATSVVGGEADFSNVAITSFGGQGLFVSGGTLELGGQSASVSSLSQGGGTIDGTGTLTLTGGASLTSSWDAFTGTGTTVLQGTTYDPGYVALDGGRILENQGTFNWTGPLIYLGYNPNTGSQVGGGAIQNDAGANFNIQRSLLQNSCGLKSFVVFGCVKRSF
jgi:hypothetical protein